MDLKPASSMLTMRDDMSGAACILGVMSKLKEFSPNIEVHGIIAACENMIGPNAYKPGDILRAKMAKQSKSTTQMQKAELHWLMHFAMLVN